MKCLCSEKSPGCYWDIIIMRHYSISDTFLVPLCMWQKYLLICSPEFILLVIPGKNSLAAIQDLNKEVKMAKEANGHLCVDLAQQ